MDLSMPHRHTSRLTHPCAKQHLSPYGQKPSVMNFSQSRTLRGLALPPRPPCSCRHAARCQSLVRVSYPLLAPNLLQYQCNMSGPMSVYY